MRKLLLVGIPLAVLFFAASATNTYAQDTPKGEVFVGYSYMHDDLPNRDLNLNGFDIAGAGYVNKWLGIEGDVSAHFDGHDHVSIMGGPKFAFSSGKIVPYAHVLAGVDGTIGFTDDDTAFTMAVGGGVDARLSDHVTIRVVQVDYQPLFYSNVANNVRVSTGVVFTFGKK